MKISDESSLPSETFDKLVGPKNTVIKYEPILTIGTTIKMSKFKKGYLLFINEDDNKFAAILDNYWAELHALELEECEKKRKPTYLWKHYPLFGYDKTTQSDVYVVDATVLYLLFSKFLGIRKPVALPEEYIVVPITEPEVEPVIIKKPRGRPRKKDGRGRPKNTSREAEIVEKIPE